MSWDDSPSHGSSSSGAVNVSLLPSVSALTAAEGPSAILAALLHAPVWLPSAAGAFSWLLSCIPACAASAVALSAALPLSAAGPEAPSSSWVPGLGMASSHCAVRAETALGRLSLAGALSLSV